MKGNKKSELEELLGPFVKKVKENIEKLDNTHEAEIEKLRRKYFGANKGWFYEHRWAPDQRHNGFRRLEVQKAIKHLISVEEQWFTKRDAWVNEQLKEQLNALNDLLLQAAKLQMTIGFVQKSLTSARKDLRKEFRKNCPLSVESTIRSLRARL